MTVLSGSGVPTFSGVIGDDTALNNLSINATDTDSSNGATAALSIPTIGDSAGSPNAGANVVTIGSTDTASVTFSGDFYRTDGNFVVTATSAADKITFNGASTTVTTSGDLVDLNSGVKLGNINTLTINTNFGNALDSGGDVEIAGAIAGTSNENLTITTGNKGGSDDPGSVTFSGNVGAASGSASQISTLTVNAATAITVGGDIVTSGAAGDSGDPDVLLTGPVVLSGNTSIVTDVGGATDGDITITGTLDGTNGQTNNFTVTSGGGAVSITGSIGATPNGA